MLCETLVTISSKVRKKPGPRMQTSFNAIKQTNERWDKLEVWRLRLLKQTLILAKHCGSHSKQSYPQVLILAKHCGSESKQSYPQVARKRMFGQSPKVYTRTLAAAIKLVMHLRCEPRIQTVVSSFLVWWCTSKMTSAGKDHTFAFSSRFPLLT